MLAINDVNIAKKYFAAVDLLSVLDTVLDDARSAVGAVAFKQKHDTMRSFYEQMAIAANFHTAAQEALKQASARLLDSDSVQTFFMLGLRSCMRAMTAMEIAVHERGDVNNSVYFRDRLRSACEDAEAMLRAIK